MAQSRHTHIPAKINDRDEPNAPNDVIINECRTQITLAAFALHVAIRPMRPKDVHSRSISPRNSVQRSVHSDIWNMNTYCSVAQSKINGKIHWQRRWVLFDRNYYFRTNFIWFSVRNESMIWLSNQSKLENKLHSRKYNRLQWHTGHFHHIMNPWSCV